MNEKRKEFSDALRNAIVRFGQGPTERIGDEIERIRQIVASHNPGVAARIGRFLGVYPSNEAVKIKKSKTTLGQFTDACTVLPERWANCKEMKATVKQIEAVADILYLDGNLQNVTAMWLVAHIQCTDVLKDIFRTSYEYCMVAPNNSMLYFNSYAKFALQRCESCRSENKEPCAAEEEIKTIVQSYANMFKANQAPSTTKK